MARRRMVRGGEAARAAARSEAFRARGFDIRAGKAGLYNVQLRREKFREMIKNSRENATSGIVATRKGGSCAGAVQQLGKTKYFYGILKSAALEVGERFAGVDILRQAYADAEEEVRKTCMIIV